MGMGCLSLSISQIILAFLLDVKRIVDVIIISGFVPPLNIPLYKLKQVDSTDVCRASF